MSKKEQIAQYKLDQIAYREAASATFELWPGGITCNLGIKAYKRLYPWTKQRSAYKQKQWHRVRKIKSEADAKRAKEDSKK